MTQDEDHLRLLSTFHYVVGGLAVLFALFPIIHLVVGLVMVFNPGQMSGQGGPPPAFIGWLFIIVAVIIMVIGWVTAGCILAAGRSLARRRHYTFCLVVACIECMFMPFGTVLGIFTIIVLMREPVKAMFSANADAPMAGA